MKVTPFIKAYDISFKLILVCETFNNIKWLFLVGVETGYRLDGREVGVRVPFGQYFCSFCIVQTDSGMYQATCQMDTVSIFLGINRYGCEAHIWTLPTVEV